MRHGTTRGLAVRLTPYHLIPGALLLVACAGPGGEATTTRTTAATGEMARSVSAETPAHDAATAPVTTLDEWKADLVRIVGDAWITSNEAYVSEAEPAVAYGTAMRLQPGGLSATGCLWSIRPDDTSRIEWRFFQAWDPVREQGMLYQSSAGGMVGFGHFQRVEGEPDLVQDFNGPAGPSFRAGHYETWEGEGTRVSRSVNWDEGRWAPRREYIWHRDPEAPIPCDEWR